MRRRRVLYSVPVVAGGEGDRNSNMIEMPIVGRRGFAGKLDSAPGVGNDIGVRPRIVFCRDQVSERICRGLDQQDLAIRADGVCDFDVERDFKRPASVGRRVTSSASLINFFETTIRRGAGRKAKLLAIDAEIAFDVWVIVGVDDRYSLDGASRCREAISGPELQWAVTAGRRRGSRNTAAVCNDTCVAAAGPEGGRAGANRAMTSSD